MIALPFVGIVPHILPGYFWQMAFKSSQSYFHVSRKDRRGSLLLLSIVVLCCILPFAFFLFYKEQVTEDRGLDQSLANLKTKQLEARQQKSFKKDDADYRPYDHPSGYSPTKYVSKKKGILFSFDPNTLSAEGWKKLGLRDKTIATILNFRSKGGRFREPGDIRKIWGLFPDEADRLMPYVTIAEDQKTPQRNDYRSPGNLPGNNIKYAALTIIDANTADTSAFIALPGIGSKLSQRIINFRDKLGGFYAIEQVKETFGLPDSVYQKIKPMLQVSGNVKQLNINTASAEELRLHPYIKYHIANALVEYRKQHGNYQSPEEVRKIMIITDEIYQKLQPYLKIE